MGSAGAPQNPLGCPQTPPLHPGDSKPFCPGLGGTAAAVGDLLGEGGVQPRYPHPTPTAATTACPMPVGRKPPPPHWRRQALVVSEGLYCARGCPPPGGGALRTPPHALQGHWGGGQLSGPHCAAVRGGRGGGRGHLGGWGSPPLPGPRSTGVAALLRGVGGGPQLRRPIGTPRGGAGGRWCRGSGQRRQRGST